VTWDEPLKEQPAAVLAVVLLLLSSANWDLPWWHVHAMLLVTLTVNSYSCSCTWCCYCCTYMPLSGWWRRQHFYDFVAGVVVKQFHDLHQQSVSGRRCHKPGGEVKVDQRPSSGSLGSSKQCWWCVHQSTCTLSKPQIKQCVSALYIFVLLQFYKTVHLHDVASSDHL